MPLLPQRHPSLTTLRTFTSTCQSLAKSTKKCLEFEHSAIPPYPYGPSAWYKQSNLGLYGLQKIRFGNTVSKKHSVKNRRYWRPNVHRKNLYSEALGKMLRVRVTTRVLRTIDKVGGLDEYLLGDKARRIKELGMGGWKLRWRIMQTKTVKERFRKEREAAGLLCNADSTQQQQMHYVVGADGALSSVGKEQVDEEIRRYDEELEREAAVDIGEDIERAEDEGKVLHGDFMAEEQPGGRNKVLS